MQNSLAVRLKDYKNVHQPYEIMSLISVKADIKRHMATREEHTLLNGDGRVYNEYYKHSNESVGHYQDFIAANNITTFTNINISFIVWEKLFVVIFLVIIKVKYY